MILLQLETQKASVSIYNLKTYMTPSQNVAIPSDLSDEVEDKENKADETKPAVSIEFNGSLPTRKPKTFLNMVQSKYKDRFNRPRLAGFLKRFGQFPDNYRAMLWKYILQLPENNAACTALVSKGVHPSWKDLRKKYPMKSEKNLKNLER